MHVILMLPHHHNVVYCCVYSLPSMALLEGLSYFPMKIEVKIYGVIVAWV